MALTGAVFNDLLAEGTVSEAGERGVRITTDQARDLDGLLSGASGAQRTLEQIAGERAGQVHEAVRQAFVDALGTSLKVSAALIAVGLVLTLILMRRSEPVDETASPPVLGGPTPRPAPRY